MTTKTKEKFDVKNTLEVIKLGASVSKAVKNAKADGKVDAMDLMYLVPVMGTVGPAFDDISLVPKELADVDSDESKEILEASKEIIGEWADDADLANKINKYLKAGLAIAEAVFA